MLTSHKNHAPSRVPGRGALAAALRLLVFRVGRYAEYRARTADEARWAAALFDQLEAAYRSALVDPAVRADLAAVDRRRAISSKTRHSATQEVST